MQHRRPRETRARHPRDRNRSSPSFASTLTFARRTLDGPGLDPSLKRRLPGRAAILEHPEEAATVPRRISGDDNLPERALSMLDVAGRILGLDPATRDALFCGVGARWFEDLRAMPKRAVLDALDRTMAGAADARSRGHRFESCRARQLLRPFLPTHGRRTPPRGARPGLQECAPLYGADSRSGRAKT